MKEPSEGNISPENEKPIDMNNFRFNLPGGIYRTMSHDPERKKVMDTIDQLLETEFSHLDVNEIYSTVRENSQTAIAAFNQALSQKSFEGLDEITRPAVAAAAAANEELRPLFDRLVKLGFDPELLVR